MHPSELTVDVVRKELETIIESYPFETGAFNVVKYYYDSGEEYVDPVCVYYTDENGTPISGAYGYDRPDAVLATPVCIIGKWIEEFHPEFKEDEVIRNILIKNATIRSLEMGGTTPFKPEVQKMLAIAQDTQDRGDRTWSSIDLDAETV